MSDQNNKNTRQKKRNPQNMMIPGSGLPLFHFYIAIF